MVATERIEEILKKAVDEELKNVFLGSQSLDDYESIDEAVEELLSPENEGYSVSYANIVENAENREKEDGKW